jgi:hypothetical protein
MLVPDPETPLMRNDCRRVLCEQFENVLAQAARERNQRQDTVTTGHGREPGWVVYERQQMHAAVNAARTGLGFSDVSAADIERAERKATGHADYARQFAWGCACLALP